MPSKVLERLYAQGNRKHFFAKTSAWSFILARAKLNRSAWVGSWICNVWVSLHRSSYTSISSEIWIALLILLMTTFGCLPDPFFERLIVRSIPLETSHYTVNLHHLGIHHSTLIRVMRILVHIVIVFFLVIFRSFISREDDDRSIFPFSALWCR